MLGYPQARVFYGRKRVRSCLECNSRAICPAPLVNLARKGRWLRRKLWDLLPAQLQLRAREGRHAIHDSALRLFVILRLQQRAFGRTPDLVHPRFFTDKIRWRMLYDRRPLLQTCSDRLAAREYAAARGGEEYLIPLLGVYDRPEQVPWAELCPPYVVKTTHGCEMNIIVRDHSDVDPNRFQQLLSGWLKINYYHRAWEWSYKHVPRRIIVERFIGEDGKIPEDFKMHCFGGEPQLISVCYDRHAEAKRWVRRDPSWNILPLGVDDVHSDSSQALPSHLDSPPPRRLAEMLELARRLSRGFDYIRVDLYCVGDRVYFGELTPTPAAGTLRFSDDLEAWLGAFWHLPNRAGLGKARRSS